MSTAGRAKIRSGSEFIPMKKYTLQQKIGFALIAIYLVVFLFVLLLTPSAVYLIASGTQAREGMRFNQQIAMRMEARFSELARFSGMVTADSELNAMLAEELQNPSTKNQARLRLEMSHLIQKDGISTYQVLGMYLEIDGKNGFATNTVGLDDELIHYTKTTILKQYQEGSEACMFTEPFDVSSVNSLSLFGNDFSKGFGYVRPYSMNGIHGTLVIIASYDGIAYITDDLKDACTEYLLLSANGRQIEPDRAVPHINVEEITQNYIYGDSYQEGYYVTSDGIYTVRDVYSGNWHILTYMSRGEVIARNQPQGHIIMISFSLFGLVSIISVTAITHKYVRPLKDVSRQMDAIANGNFNARVPILSQDEIGQVSESFNIMAAKLEHVMAAMLEKEKLEQKMRYSLLIAQVDPHFIYNTMNTITYLAQKGENENVIVVNKAMIGILQDRLRIEIDDIYDHVAQEINVVEQYLTIQRYRYQGIFKEKIQVAHDVRGELLLKNLLQPLVENALSHGILENKDENGEPLGGCISIDIHREADMIIARVSDNGMGMSSERLAQVQNDSLSSERGKKIGLRNVRERIAYIYGQAASLNISSREGIGTEVVLSLPLVRHEERNRAVH